MADDLDEAPAVKPFPRFGGRSGGGRQRQHGCVHLAQRELAVEGGRIRRRAAEMVGRRVLISGCTVGAAKPVPGSRQAERPTGDFHDLGKVRNRGFGIVEVFERKPAGVKLGLGPFRAGLCGVPGGDPIGAGGIAVFAQRARYEAPLDPPRIGVAKRRLVPRRCGQQTGRLVDLARPAQPLDARVQVKRIGLGRRRERGQQSAGF